MKRRIVKKYAVIFLVLIPLLLFGINAFEASADVIIDNGAAGTSYTGTWPASGGTTPYGANSLWARNGATYTWQFTSQPSGTYEVYMWWSGYTSRPSSVDVEILNANGTNTVNINQKLNAGQWNSLGQFQFNGSGSVKIIAANGATVSTCADAVWFRYVPSGVPTETIIDNGDLATSFTGTWDVSGAPNPYGANSVYGKNGETYTWRFTPDVSGQYALSMWWTSMTSRSNNIPVDIQREGGTDRIYINQQTNGGIWNALGTYSFVAGQGYNIKITSPSTTTTCADAVKFTNMSGGGNSAPVANNDTATTQENSPVTIDVLGNDTDSDGTIDPATCAVTANPSHGLAVANIDGTILYTPNSNYTGDDTFKYSVKDNDGATSNEATVTLTVTAAPVNSPPVAVNDSAQTITNTPVTINVASNDTDADGSLDLTTCVVTGTPAHGTAAEQGNCTVLYTPTTGYNGADSFTYTVKDNDGAVSNNATVQVAVNTSINAAPKANNDAADATMNSPVTINVVANDTDSDGTINPSTCTVMSTPLGGTAVAQSNGTVLYTPNTGYTGKDTFTYTVKDNLGQVSNTATVTVTVGMVIDNGGPNTSFTGTWDVSGAPSPYGANSVYGKNGETYTWRFTPTVSGMHTLYMWWTYMTSRSDEIPVDIQYWGGTATIYINQQTNASKWNSLGTYAFVAGQPYNITVRAPGSNTTTCADAMRFVNVPGNVAPVATINSVNPNPVLPGQSIAFSGSGVDLEGPITEYSWYSTLDGPLSNQPSFSTSTLSTGVHSILFEVKDSAGVWSAEDNVRVDVNNSQVQTTEQIFWAAGYASENGAPGMTAALQSIGATLNNGIWTYVNTARNKRYLIRQMTSIQDLTNALKTEGAHVMYFGHSNYGLGQVFATTTELSKQIITDIRYIDDDRILNTSSPWVHVNVNGLRTSQAYPFWWPIFKDGTSGIMPYDFGDPRGIDPAYNYYVTYQVPGDPTYYKMETVRHSAVERFSDAPQPAWYDPAGNPPDPNNPDHLQYFITNPTPWSPSVEVSGNWTESQTDLGYFKENYRYKSAGSGNSYVKWMFTIPNPGNYKVYAWWPATSGRVTNAPYTINHGGGSTTVLANQRLNGGKWNELGTFYFDAGAYSVVLTDQASGGTVAADAVKIGHADNPPDVVQADFYASTRYGGVPLEIGFTNQGTGDLTGRYWTFGDGFDNDTRDDIDHVYADLGSYTVSLTVSGPAGSSTKTKTNYITVGTATPPFQAEFSASSRQGTLPRSVSFRDRSTGHVSRLWDFGDGTTSTIDRPTHVYTQSGNYTVTLTVTDINNNQLTETKPNFVRAYVYEKNIDNVDYPKTHYGSKTILFRKALEVPKEEMRFSRLLYTGCDSGHYYPDSFNRGIMFYATNTTGEGDVAMSEYLKAYVNGSSDYELWQIMQNMEPVYDYYDFNKPPSQQW